MRTIYVFIIALIFYTFAGAAALEYYIYYKKQQESKFEEELRKPLEEEKINLAKEFYFKGVEDVLYSDAPETYVKDYNYHYLDHYHSYVMQKFDENKTINKPKLSHE